MNLRSVVVLRFATPLLAGAMLFVSNGLAETFNAVSDFPSITSSTSPINGVWAYGYATTLSPVNFATDLPAVNYFGDGNASGFSEFGGESLPTILKNTTGATIPVEAITIGPWPADLLLMHPGPNEYSVLQFTAPVTGTYSVNGEFLEIGSNYGNTGNTGVTTDSVIQGGSTSLFVAYSASTPASFNLSPHLTAGETLDFAVGLGPTGQFSYDSTGFNANISVSTPEPASVFDLAAMLASLGIAAWLWRKQIWLA